MPSGQQPCSIEELCRFATAHRLRLLLPPTMNVSGRTIRVDPDLGKQEALVEGAKPVFLEVEPAHMLIGI